jgi:hypothetical protein
MAALEKRVARVQHAKLVGDSLLDTLQSSLVALDCG